MNEDISIKLWVVKFCIKVAYPKYNHYAFLVFLAIKFRIWWMRSQTGTKGMDKFEVKPIPACLTKFLLKDKVEDNLPVVEDKCILISKEQYIQLCSENLFYRDKGVLWLTIKLSPDFKRKYKEKKNINQKQSNILKYNLNFVTSEIHKRLWTDSGNNNLDNIRIVPVVGTKSVVENTVFVTENELYNISSSFNLNADNFEVTFHSIPSIDYSPKIAAVAEVSLIVNEYDLSNDFTKEVLSNHFEVPRLLSVNDVFSIELTHDITRKYHHKYQELIQNVGKIYFKCKKLVSDVDDSENKDQKKENIVRVFFIVKGVTQLSLGENIHLLKPKDEYFKSQDSESNNHNVLQICPTGLREKFSQIQETISPFLTGDINDLSASLSSPIIPMVLLTGSLGSGRHLLVKTIAKYNGMNCLSIDCNALQSSTAKQTESKINATIQKAKTCAPVIVMLDNFEVFAVDPENNEDCRLIEHFMNTLLDLYQNYSKHLIVFVAVTERQDLKPNILRLFLDKIHIPKLNADQRYEMLEWFSRAMQLNIDGEESKNSKEINEECNLNKSSKEVLQRVAAKTEMFQYGDLDTLLHFAVRESYLKQHNKYNQPPIDPDLRLVKEEDFNSALESIRSLQSQHLDAPKIPKVYWEDIGGLDKLKKELMKTIEFPIKYPHLFKNSSIKRSGILLYGPPGCGKTLVAKAVSTELNVSFLSVKGPELLNMYIGQSEENVRKDTHSSSMVFVMGATNRPDLLEQSLLRPGRLDKMTYVGPYCGQQEKTAVLTALSRKYKLRPEVSLAAVAAALPERCTGADLLAVVSAARAAAVRQLVARLHAGLIKESELSTDCVILGVSELWHGVESFRPSVTEDELAYYESLQNNL